MSPDSIIKTIEQQTWLLPLEEKLKRGLDTAFQADRANGKPVENTLHGVWLGHALHPLLTDVPTGAWSVAFILDLIEGSTGARQYRAGADAAVTIGLVGAAGAALTGWTDWKEISTKARRTGLVHGLLNTVAVGLYLTSAVQRSRGKRGVARAFAYAAFGITMGSAWLGGHLVYANQIAVERTAPQTPPEDFVAVLPLSELEEEKPTKASYRDYPLLLVRKAEKIYALADICSHLGAPLSEGKLEGNCIRCPWHGSLFSLDDGEVIESPAVRPQAVFEARVKAGQIEVRVRKDVGADTGPAQSRGDHEPSTTG